MTFVGNATTLIGAGGLTLLTDPNFLHRGQRAYLGYGLVSKRLQEPALSIDELPPIDAVVLSHMHGDHWDRVSQKRLDHGLPIITTPHAAKRLRRRGFAGAQGLSTWQQHTIGNGGVSVTITSMPGRHLPWGLTVTMDGRQGAELAAMLTLPKVIPVHFDDYGVFASPLADFVREMAERGLADRVIELCRGASITL